MLADSPEEIRQNILKAYSRVKDRKVSDYLKTEIIYVLSGSKPNITFENPNEMESFEIVKICRKLGLICLKIRSFNIIKYVVGTSQEDVDRIIELNNTIFSPNIQDRTIESTIEYGLLMGYPKCCCKTIRSTIRSVSKGHYNAVGQYFKLNSPWPYCMNCCIPLIYHLPCSPKCQQTQKIGKDFLNTRQMVFNMFSKANQERLKNKFRCKTLHFDQNQYILFKLKKEDKTEIREILKKRNNPTFENTLVGYPTQKQSEFINLIEVNDKVEVEGDKITLSKPDRTITHKKIDPSVGVLFEFV